VGTAVKENDSKATQALFSFFFLFLFEPNTRQTVQISEARRDGPANLRQNHL
jgi:hypothetical protein